MKKYLITLVLGVGAIIFSNAQQIKIEKVFGGYKFTQNEELLRMRDLVNVMKSNEEAFTLIKKAQTNHTLSSVIGFVGGGFIGWPVGTALGGGEANWTFAGIGAGLVAIGIPISSGVVKNAKQAVEVYNSSLTSASSYEFKPKFKIISNNCGIGFLMDF